MGANIETHNQTLAGVTGAYQKREMKDCESQRTPEEHNPQKHKQVSQGLKRQTQTLYGSELGPLHTPYVIAAWCSVALPTTGM